MSEMLRWTSTITIVAIITIFLGVIAFIGGWIKIQRYKEQLSKSVSIQKINNKEEQ